MLGEQGAGSQAKQGEPDNRRRERDNRPRQCLRASRARPKHEHPCHGNSRRHQQGRAQPCHHNGGWARFGKHLADLGSAVFGGGGQSREAQLQQRSRQHGVREQVDGVCPGEPRQGTLITGLLRRPVDQQHTELLEHQADDPGRGDRHDHRTVTLGKPQPGPEPQPDPAKRHQRAGGQGKDTQCRAPAQSGKRLIGQLRRLSRWLKEPQGRRS